MGVMAWGMWRARYWAVLGFQLLLVFLIFSAVFGLAVQASSVGRVRRDPRPARRRRQPLLLHGQGDGAHPDAFPASRRRPSGFYRLRSRWLNPSTRSSSAGALVATSPRSAPPSWARRPPWSSATSRAAAASTTPASRPRPSSTPPSSTTRRATAPSWASSSRTPRSTGTPWASAAPPSPTRSPAA